MKIFLSSVALFLKAANCSQPPKKMKREQDTFKTIKPEPHETNPEPSEINTELSNNPEPFEINPRAKILSNSEPLEMDLTAEMNPEPSEINPRAEILSNSEPLKIDLTAEMNPESSNTGPFEVDLTDEISSNTGSFEMNQRAEPNPELSEIDLTAEMNPELSERIPKEYSIKSNGTTFSIIPAEKLNSILGNQNSQNTCCGLCSNNYNEVMVVITHDSKKNSPSFFHLGCFYNHYKRAFNCPCCDSNFIITAPILKRIGLGAILKINPARITGIQKQAILDIIMPVYKDSIEDIVSFFLSEDLKIEVLEAIIEILFQKSIHDNINGEYDDVFKTLLTIKVFKLTMDQDEISIPPNFINENNLSLVCMILSRKTNLRVLKLSGNSIGACDPKVIAKMLQKLVNLEKVDLSCNQIAGNISEISEALEKLPKLRELNLSNNMIEDCYCLLNSLIRSTELTSLSLAGNRINETGAVWLSILMKALINLETLDISKNCLGETGAGLIGNALKVARKLSSLDISWNSISSSGAEAIAKGLRGNTVLEFLNVSNNEILNTGVMEIANVLSELKNLKTFNASWNKIDGIGVCEVLKALENSEKMEVLDFSHNNTSSENADEIIYLISKLPSLKVLKFSGNPIGRVMYDRLRTSGKLQVTF